MLLKTLPVLTAPPLILLSLSFLSTSYTEYAYYTERGSVWTHDAYIIVTDVW